MTDEKNKSKLLELAPAELVIPLKVSHAGRTYRVRHILRPPAPADWFAYEAALQMAIEELPAQSDVPDSGLPDSDGPDSDEPSYRLQMRSTDAALLLWDRLLCRVEGYALPQPQRTQVDASPATRDEPLSAAANNQEPRSAGQGSGPNENNAARSASAVPSGHGFSRAEKDAARSASWEGGRGNPPPGFPETPAARQEELNSGSDWRLLIPLAHKEAAVRALTLVAPAAPDSFAADSSNGFYPLCADEIPVILEAALAGFAYPRLLHRFRPPSVQDERTYRRLLAENLIVRGTRHPRTLIPSRLPALVRLYDQLILGVEGYAVHAQPPASSFQLIQHMDAWHKRVAVQTLFGDLSADSPSVARVAPSESEELPADFSSEFVE